MKSKESSRLLGDFGRAFDYWIIYPTVSGSARYLLFSNTNQVKCYEAVSKLERAVRVRVHYYIEVSFI